MHTSRSSCFFLNSASVLDESQSTLCSRAISFKTFNLKSDGATLTESFSISCRDSYKKKTKILLSKTQMSKSESLKHFLTVRFTPLSGLSSEADETNSFPYFVVNKFLICINSGKSEHLGDAKIILATASCNSEGHSLPYERSTNLINTNYHPHNIDLKKATISWSWLRSTSTETFIVVEQVMTSKTKYGQSKMKFP